MRVKGGYVSHRRHKRWLKLAKGYYGSRHLLWKTAHQSVVKALAHAYIGRKKRKGDFRRLWIGRISAACKANDTSYSVFMHGLKLAKIDLNRKMLSEIAISDPDQFAALVKLSLKALKAKPKEALNAAAVTKVSPRAAILPAKTKAKTVKAETVKAAVTK